MDYFVLAYKGERKTYEMSDTLDDAYFDADALKEKGWTIYSILSAEVKEDYVSDYKDIKLAVKNLCKDYKKIIDTSNDILSKEQFEDIKREILDKLEEDEISARAAEYYIGKLVEECLGWNEITYNIIKHAQKLMKEGKLKGR